MSLLFISVGIGALIGYITNYVAIKLLFRPYKPIKIKNITIFPAGVIPREKRALAKKVGEVVKKYILSKEEIKQIVTSKEVKEEIERFLDKKLDEMLNQDIYAFVSKDEFAKKISSLINTIINQKFPMFAGFINQEQLERLFRELDLDIKLNSFLDKKSLKEKLFSEIEWFLENELPEILLKAQIDKIVEKRVSNFDEKELEDMLFVLMKKHFSFINFAGAFLGGIIGFVQYLIISG